MGSFGTVLLVASRSLRYRLSGVLLTIASVALSVFVLLGVEHVRQEARTGFASTVSGVDLIVGARTGEINLLLLSIFRIGTATANVSWESVEQLEQQKNVVWTVPISLGDSHRSFRVIGTTEAFFTRYKYGAKQSITFKRGQSFEAVAEVVLGARVATELGYQLGDSLVLSHGMADTSFSHHDQLPFSVSGILAATGTPIDNALFVGLEAIEAMHSDGESEDHQGHNDHDEHDGHDEHEEHEDHDGHENHDAHEEHDEHHAGQDHPPIGTVTAVLVGLNSPITTLQVKRWVDEFADEALLAILPGVALTQLWELVGNVEAILLGISILILVSSLLGLNAMLLASMRERRREIEVLRSIGAPSSFIVSLLMIESLLIVSVGVVLAVLSLLASITAANTLFAETFGLMISSQILSPSNITALGLIYLTAILVTLLPALQAYRVSRAVGTAAAAD